MEDLSRCDDSLSSIFLIAQPSRLSDTASGACPAVNRAVKHIVDFRHIRDHVIDPLITIALPKSSEKQYLIRRPSHVWTCQLV